MSILLIGLFSSMNSVAKDCGPIPPGTTFGPNCEIVAIAPPNYKAKDIATRLEITLQSGSEPEKKAKTLIEEFAKKYDLKKYFFTTRIHIQSYVIPHSHPVLTLNTRTIGEPDRYLALFLHEQIHWFFDLKDHTQKTKLFIEKMKLKFPKIPSQQDGGAADEESTYLHLGVCYYELEQLTNLIGKAKAEQIFKTDKIYFWVRQQVLANTNFIQKALNETGLQWQDAEKIELQ